MDNSSVGMIKISQLFMESQSKFHGSIIDYYIPLYPIKKHYYIPLKNHVPVTTNQLYLVAHSRKCGWKSEVPWVWRVKPSRRYQDRDPHTVIMYIHVYIQYNDAQAHVCIYICICICIWLYMYIHDHPIPGAFLTTVANLSQTRLSLFLFSS